MIKQLTSVVSSQDVAQWQARRKKDNRQKEQSEIICNLNQTWTRLGQRTGFTFSGARSPLPLPSAPSGLLLSHGNSGDEMVRCSVLRCYLFFTFYNIHQLGFGIWGAACENAFSTSASAVALAGQAIPHSDFPSRKIQ